MFEFNKCKVCGEETIHENECTSCVIDRKYGRSFEERVKAKKKYKEKIKKIYVSTLVTWQSIQKKK